MNPTRNAGEPDWHRRLGLVVLSAVLGILLGRLTTVRSRAGDPRPAPEVPVTTAGASVAGSGSGDPRRARHGTSVGYGLLASLVLALAGWLVALGRWLPGAFAATAAVLVLIVALRGSARRRGRWASGVLAGLAVLAVSLDLVLIVSQMKGSVSDVNGLLVPLMLFIVVVGAVAWLVASWGRVVLAEVGALLLIALMLGFISFNGIPRFTAPVSAPEPGGDAAVVFTADPASELSVEFTYESLGPGETRTYLRVGPAGFTSGLPHRAWAILLLDGLRFQENQRSGSGVSLTDSAYRYQILSGTLGETPSEYSGLVTGSFEHNSASRSVVHLPPVYTADPAQFSSISDVEHAVGFAFAKPRSATISVDCGKLGPLETVTQASPPLETQNQLSWRAQDKLAITYATFDQGAEDQSRNVLFVIAILLGAAIACLVAAMQVLLRTNNP